MKVNVVSRFWSEQDGAILSAEIVLVATILVIGLIAGLTSLRDSVVTELADVGAAISALNQSFSYGGIDGHCGLTAGGIFADVQDFCDLATGSNTFLNSKCVVICTGTLTAAEGAGSGT